jgi:hypothetical protein
MSSVTSPQQTDRRGTDEIPGPRGGQGVRLLVLGADPEAQTLRDQATAAGYELAQRYSARVSHVAYGSGVDPGDARYTKIRDAGLVLLPLQKCAVELGLGRADAMDTDAEAEVPTEAETGPETEAVAQAEVATVSGIMADVEAGAGIEAVTVSGIMADVEAGAGIEAVTVSGTMADVEAGAGIEAAIFAEPEYVSDDAPLEIPPLHPVAEAIEVSGAADLEDAIVEEPIEAEADVEIADDVSATAFVPGFADEVTGAPLAAAVIGLDPWIGAAEEDEDAEEIPHSEAPTPAPAQPAGHVLFSILWALIPFATFGLLSPFTFGYAAYRLRSRALVLTAVGYTIAVVASFVLSAVRPHSATPSDTAGALLTLCLAGTWIGGTLHAVSIRTRVFAR